MGAAWATPWLRPWLSNFHRCLATPSPDVRGVSQDILRSAFLGSCDLVVSHSCGPLERGEWIARIGHYSPSSTKDLWNNARFDESDRTYVGVSSHKSKRIIVNSEAKQAAEHWRYMLRSAFALHSLWTPMAMHLHAAADAFADEHNAGIGCWLSLERPSSPSEVFWFSVAFNFNDIPDWWRELASSDIQRSISSFELLAQVALVAAKFAIWGREAQTVSIELRCDNTPAEGVSNKLFTTNSRLIPIVLNLMAWLTTANVRVAVSHIAGSANEWADRLSRQSFANLGFADDKRVSLDWLSLWRLRGQSQLIPADAFWHDYVTQVANARN